MKREAKITGMNEVMKNLNAEIKAIEGRSSVGLIKSAVLIRRSMDETPPLVPIDTGNLRGSWMPGTIVKSATGIGLIIGFSANYAVFVHENIGAKFKRPGAGAKFFEASIKRNRDNVLKILRDNAQIK